MPDGEAGGIGGERDYPRTLHELPSRVFSPPTKCAWARDLPGWQAVCTYTYSLYVERLPLTRGCRQSSTTQALDCVSGRLEHEIAQPASTV